MNPIYDMRGTEEECNGLKDLVNYISSKKDKDLVMIEVGSYTGQSMEIFANTGKIKQIICIDPWKPHYDDQNDLASDTDMVEVEKLFDERVSKITNVKILKHKGTLDSFVVSKDFLENLNGKIDFVYIDASHIYEACKHDILICKVLIKPIIAITGHDYLDYWNGVKQAVNEVFEKPDITFQDYSWAKLI